MEVPMSQLMAMFCDIDDFCKWFEPLYMRRLLQSGQRQRTRQTALALSEIMTIIVSFHRRHYRDCKHYYTEYVATPLRPYFPALVSSSRFVELMPRAVGPLCGYLHTRKAAARASPLSIRPRWRCATIAVSAVTRSLRAMPRGANHRWAGSLAASCL